MLLFLFQLSLLLKMSLNFYFSLPVADPLPLLLPLFSFYPISLFSPRPPPPPTSPHPSLPVKIVQSCWQSISWEDSRQTVCLSAGCFCCIVAETLSDCISPELLKPGSLPALSLMRTHTHTLISMPVMTAERKNSHSCMNMSTNTGWLYPQLSLCMKKKRWHVCTWINTNTHKK